MVAVVEANAIRSSVPLELLLRLNSKLGVLFFLLISLLFIYKISTLPYPLHVLISEALIISSFGPIEAIRISWARRGNLTETPANLLFSLLLSLAVASICAYIAILQNYIALAEQIAAGAEFTIVSLEALFQIVAICAFSGKR